MWFVKELNIYVKIDFGNVSYDTCRKGLSSIGKKGQRNIKVDIFLDVLMIHFKFYGIVLKFIFL